jgi:hypothetical protein
MHLKIGSKGIFLVFLAQAQKWPDFKTARLRTEPRRVEMDGFWQNNTGILGNILPWLSPVI